MEMGTEELEIDWGMSMNPSALPTDEYELINKNEYGLMIFDQHAT
jgi:hypothetical protein